MRFAYADPPYLGQAHLYRDHPDFAGEVDHGALITRLVAEFPDGWALSCSTPSLRLLLPMCPEDVRIGAWVKPFCSFKPNVNPAYAWEPVIWRGGRRRDRTKDTVRDWLAENITLRRGLTGAKPAAFCRWVFDLLGAEPGDALADLFPGTGAVSDEWERWVAPRAAQAPLFAGKEGGS